MKRKQLRRAGLGAGLSLCAVVAVGCNVVEPAPFTPRAIQAIQRESAEAVPQGMRPLPTTLQTPYLPANSDRVPSAATTRVPPTTRPSYAPSVRLSLQEVVHRAVINNADVRVSGYDSAIDAMRVIEAEARFDATFFSNYQHQMQNQQSNPFALPLETIGVSSDTLQSGVRQLLPNGAQLELRAQTARNKIEDVFPESDTNPYYDNQLILQLTQPLLRDVGDEVNRARITVARNDRKISLLEWRVKMEQTLADLEEAYWRLQLALREVQIAEELLDRTIEMANTLVQRWGQDVSSVQMAQANATIEARRTALVRARGRVGDFSDAIKRLMGDPEFPVASPVLILPATDPFETPLAFDEADQIEAAMENRADLAQQIYRIDSATLITKVGKNNLLPQLNFQGSVAAQGLDGDWGEATSKEFQADILNYSVGLAFEVPIGNRSARAIYRRTLLQRMQAIDQYAALTQTASQEVSRAMREVQTSWEELGAARKARFAAAKALQTIEDQEAAEVARTPTFVQLKLDRQGSLAETERAEATALAAYNIAVSALERTKGTILRYNNVVLDEDRLPGTTLP